MRDFRTDFAPAIRAIRLHEGEDRAIGPGVEGNTRLTALTGLVLLVLLFVEGITVVNVRGLLSMHVFVGLVLIPPLLLKTASTGYRFASYYLGSHQYRAAGPPQIFLRVIAPFLLASTVGLFGTGVILLALGAQVPRLLARHPSDVLLFLVRFHGDSRAGLYVAGDQIGPLGCEQFANWRRRAPGGHSPEPGHRQCASRARNRNCISALGRFVAAVGLATRIKSPADPPAE